MIKSDKEFIDFLQNVTQTELWGNHSTDEWVIQLRMTQRDNIINGQKMILKRHEKMASLFFV